MGEAIEGPNFGQGRIDGVKSFVYSIDWELQPRPAEAFAELL